MIASRESLWLKNTQVRRAGLVDGDRVVAQPQAVDRAQAGLDQDHDRCRASSGRAAARASARARAGP